jgi:tetratricopeptide (TPR) repeat protein
VLFACGSAVTAVNALCQITGTTDFLARGVAAYEAGRFDEAERLLVESVKANEPPANRDLYLGRTNTELARPERAEFYLNLFTKEHPADPDGWYALGYLFFRANRPQESLHALERAGHLRAPSAVDFRVGGTDYVLLGDFATSIDFFKRALVLEPQDLLSRYYLGRAYYNDNDFQDAVAAFEAVLKVSPKHLRAKDNLALAFAGLGRNEQAEVTFREAVAWNASASPKMYPLVDLGSFLYEQGRLDDAQHLLEQATAMSETPESRSDLARAELVLGKIALNRNDPGTAARYLESAIMRNPNNSGGHYLLGKAYKMLGRGDDAEKQFRLTQQILKTSSGDP